ncbi:MAG: Fic family protein [Elusimicrobiota bacterium]|jgi:Fic family protein|nr:Fic family protein [Elusimicrobiota bacterium]
MNTFIAGTYKQQLKYKSFLPSKINRDFDFDDKELSLLLEKASVSLGQMDAFSVLVPSIELFIEMHILKEAALSSKIEGTQTTLEDAAKPEEIIAPEQKDDWAEVQNYTRALNFAIERLETFPISMRLIKETHAILLSGVRGSKKYPGEIRISQNWIGGASLQDAAFIPPHPDDLPDLLSDLELFWHNGKLQIPLLFKIAIFHYQIETIHPFCDGNGRIGRLMIPLMLISQKILSKPSLYISDFFEKNRASYYEGLAMVKNSNNLSDWIKFFLSGIIATADIGVETLKNIVLYKKGIDEKLLSMGAKAKSANILLSEMFKTPIISVKRAADILKCSYGRAARLIEELTKRGITERIDDKVRNKYFKLSGYLDLFK